MATGKTQIDIVVITALEEELLAALAQLPGYKKLEKDDTDPHTYYEAEIKTQRIDGAVYKTIVTCLVGMGPIKAAEKTVDIHNKWKPRIVLLVGIAGGIKGEIALGDVLIADQIADTTEGKIKDAQVGSPRNTGKAQRSLRSKDKKAERQIRWKAIPVNSNLLDQALNYPTGWEQYIKAHRPKAGHPKRYIGTVVSGGDVITHAPILAEYKRQWPKLAGVEMEGGAVASALHSRTEQTAFLMIRGISDLADGKKNSRATKIWRPYACAVAAAYAVKLLEEGPIKSKGPKRSTRSKVSQNLPKALAPVALTLAVDGNSSNQIQFETSKILKGIEEIGKRQERIQASLNLNSNLSELLKIAEADNPGMSFTAETSATGTTYIIGPKPELQNKEIGHLAFQITTAAGRRGREKFEKAMDEGLPVEFEPEECQWKSHLKLPWHSISERDGKLRIEHRLPDIKIPIRLTSQRASRVMASLDMTYASVVRAGRKVTEIRMAGGHLAGEFLFKMYRDSANVEVSVKVNLGLTSASRALDTVNLLLAMHNSPDFAIEFLEKGSKIHGKINNVGVPKKYLLHVRKLLTVIKKVNDDFGVDMRFPDVLNNKEEQHLMLLSGAIDSKGAVNIAPGTLTAKSPKSEIQNILKHIDPKKSGTMEIKRKDAAFILLGQRLELGEWITKLSGVRPTATHEEIELSLAVLNPDNEYSLTLSYKKGTEIFTRWKRGTLAARSRSAK